jgi:CRP/FNR family transcriptional regulator, cyclic AMP receptor protein
MTSSTNPRSSRNSLGDCLNECPLFCDLSPDSLKALDNIIQPISFAKGATLFVQGQLSDGVFILRSGQVKITSVTVSGLVDLLAIAKEGEAIGLSTTVSGRPHVATATAMEMTQGVLIRRDSFLQFIQQHGDAAVRVAKVLADLYDVAQEEKKYFLARQSSAQKLARFVLNWSVHQPEGGDELQLGLTHEEIGHAIGTTRETVTRTLGHLKNRRILVLEGSRLMIHNRTALRHIADA